MTFRDALALATVLTIAACTSSSQSGASAADDAFRTLAFSGEGAAPAAEPSGAVGAYLVEIALERGNGTRFAAPRLVAQPGQEAQIAVGEDVAYVAGTEKSERHDTDGGEAVKRTVHDGLTVDVCAQRAGDGGVTFGYRISLGKVARPIAEVETKSASGETVTVQVPDVTQVCAQGTRWIEPGAQAMLARLSSPDGTGPVLVLARVTPLMADKLPVPADGEFSTSAPKDDVAPASALARPMTGHTVHLRISAVRVGRDFPPGLVLDETAAPDVLKSAGGQILRDFEAYTCLDSRVRFAASAGEPSGDGKSQSVVATAADDGRVTIAWNGRTVTVRANEGRRFVAVAPVDGGGTAGVIVAVNADK